jgi:hypothetical protein
MPRLELDIAVDPPSPTDAEAVHGDQVSGTLVGPDGRAATFVGWVGLLALLQQAIAEPAPDASPASPASPTSGTG